MPFNVLNEAADLFGTNHILLQNWVTAALSPLAVSRHSQLWGSSKGQATLSFSVKREWG